MTRIKILEIYATVLLIAVVVALLYVWMASPLGTSDKVGITMAISTVALVIVTGIYAWHTRKMAEEMREQRLSEARPYILLRLGGKFVRLDGDNLNVTIENVGKGPAKNLNVALWNLDYDPIVTTKGFLGPNEDWEVEVTISSSGLPHRGNLWLPELKELVRKYSGKTIAVKYEDIHNRAWASYLCLEETDAPGYFMDGELGIVEVMKP